LCFFALAKAVDLYLSRITDRDPTLKRVTEPTSFVVKVLFTLLATVVVLENLGIRLTAVWTTLGVGSVAIALALQETLSNLFSGLYLLADRPIRPGDYIKLDSGQEGYVVHVGWRATSIRALSNNTMVVPNLSMCKAVITNYSQPDERMGFGIQISVARGTDPRRVERILTEVGKEAARDSQNGLLAEPAPSASFIPGFGSSTLDFSLGFQIRRFVDQWAVQSELRERIWERFQKEEIEIVGPAQALFLDPSLLRLLPERDGNASQSPRSEAQLPKQPMSAH
jgi:small-conductance mechanosensitive channel